MLSSLAPSSHHAKKRERERLSRQRRAVNVKQMRRTCDALECALLVSQTWGDANGVWDDFLDDHAARVRHFLRQSVKLVKETQRLQLERTVLAQLLEEHRLSTQALAHALSEHPTLQWELRAAEWHEMARSLFKPWTLDDCKAEIEKALKEASAFDWSLEKETTGFSFLGWREQRRVDRARDAFQFEFYKTYHGYEMMDSVNVGWDMYTEPKTYQEVVLNHGALCFHEVLQQLGPNIVIVWAVKPVPEIHVDTHMTYLICRVKTDRGILQCVRSICCSELMEAVTEPDNLWASCFIWKQWSRLEREEAGFTYRLGGSIHGQDPSYLSHWMLTMFGCVLRSEVLATRRQLVISDQA